ncbi:permease [Candidatus Synechococcus calcipolaris G9]|uniref:Permease n=1 Tax=Candidatus Synechococcus calcipolaris G9 TaxID=1497997 RepID=A0ABT6EVI7_9SYNE|nr:permease [Candidatus Synechococcus calcipolaris]MDG2989815.1 permease [Candidatus Synechococcus calcipolaris G9]
MDPVNQLQSGFTLFLSLLVEAFPFLLLGVLLSSLLLLFVNERKLIKLLPRSPILGALVGSLIGFLFPVCECGNVPVARRLLMQGMPTSVAIGFLLAAPTINPVVIWATWIAFRDQPEIVVFRILFSLAIATTVGWVFSSQKDLRPFLQPTMTAVMPRPTPPPATTTAVPSLLKSGTYLLGQPGQPLAMETLAATLEPPAIAAPPIPWQNRFPLLLDNIIQELRELGGILVLGSLVAAIIQVAAPRELILSLGQGPIISVITMMILATVISICSTVDAFFALAFAATFTPGSLLAFLVLGPMVDLKGLGLLLTIFRPRALVYIFVLVAQLTFLFCLFINLRWS